MRVLAGARLRPGAGLRLSASQARGLPAPVTDVYGLAFPNNENVAGAPPAGQMFAFTFTGANLPPAWPLTVIWQAKYNSAQRGYVTNFFWSTLDTGAFSSASYYWASTPTPTLLDRPLRITCSRSHMTASMTPPPTPVLIRRPSAKASGTHMAPACGM